MVGHFSQKLSLSRLPEVVMFVFVYKRVFVRNELIEFYSPMYIALNFALLPAFGF